MLGPSPRDVERLWVENNLAFLTRYWRTAREALEGVRAAPESVAEFRQNDLGQPYVDAVLTNHLENHNYAAVLLAYAAFDEFTTSLLKRLGSVVETRVKLSDLRHRGVRRFKKFLHDVCEVPADEAQVDWHFLREFGVIRNCIVHANGNASGLSDGKDLSAIVARHDSLSFKHKVRLVVGDEYVAEAILRVKATALCIIDVIEVRSADG